VAPQLERLETYARAQTEAGRTYVAPLIRGDENAVNRMFQSGDYNGTVKMRPITGKAEDLATYDNVGDWMDDFAKANATPHDVSRNMQYPRVIRFDPGRDQAAAAARLAEDGLDVRALDEGVALADGGSCGE
jgi:hypothetical protein